MIRFEFFRKKEHWVGVHHFRAWRSRLEDLAAEVSVEDGVLVSYSFLSADYASAKALDELIFAETKQSVFVHGPKLV